MINTSEKSSNYQSDYNYKKENTDNWESLYSGLEQNDLQHSIDISENNQQASNNSNLFLLKNKYIVTSVKSGLMLINVHRANERILYEQFVQNIDNQLSVSQASLFPVSLNVNAEEFELIAEIKDDLHKIGFDIQQFSKNTYVINSTPVALKNFDVEKLVRHFLEHFRSTKGDIKQNAKEKIALSMAQTAALSYNVKLSEVEMQTIIDELFSCSTPNYTQDGKTIIHILNMEDIDGLFKKG